MHDMRGRIRCGGECQAIQIAAIAACILFDTHPSTADQPIYRALHLSFGTADVTRKRADAWPTNSNLIIGAIRQPLEDMPFVGAMHL